MLLHPESHVSNPVKDHSSVLATVLYEDLESGLRARALMESVETNMDFPAEFQLDLWRFDWLAERSLGNIALSRAERSALVLISVGGTNALPAAAENWLNTWVQMEQSHPLALVVLLPKEKHGAGKYQPLHERLQAAARQKRVDFFCEFYEPSSASHNLPVSGSKEREDSLAPRQKVEFASARRDASFDGNFHSRSSETELALNAAQLPSLEVISHGSVRADSSKGRTEPNDILNQVTLLDMSPKARLQSGLPHESEGVLVACVDSNSAAFKAGLRAGDVIQQLDRQDVRAAADAVSLSQQVKGKNVLLRVWSRGDSRFLVVNRSTGNKTRRYESASSLR